MATGHINGPDEKCPVGSQEGKSDRGKVCVDYSVCPRLWAQRLSFPCWVPWETWLSTTLTGPLPPASRWALPVEPQAGDGRAEGKEACHVFPVSCLSYYDSGLAGSSKAAAPMEHRMVWLPAAAWSLGPFLVSLSLPPPLKIVPLFFRVPVSVLACGLVNHLRKCPGRSRACSLASGQRLKLDGGKRRKGFPGERSRAGTPGTGCLGRESLPAGPREWAFVSWVAWSYWKILS